jgi:AraC-like DNA-binding protein
LADLADHHGMSFRSITHHFRVMFGTTILGYVAARRMEKANAALEDGLSIDQAAHIAGFAHTTNFSAAFRNRYGHPPGKRPTRLPRGKNIRA